MGFVLGEEADRSIDALARKYPGAERYKWTVPGEQRVKFLVEPTHARHVAGVEPFRSGTGPLRRPEQ